MVNDASQPHVILDAGNLLFKHAAIIPNQEEKEKLTAETIVEAYDQIGYQAVCVGSKDLIAGIAYLQQIDKKSKFPWLSANLVRKANNKAVFTSSTTIKAGPLKVGVLGLTGPAVLAEKDEVILLPWEEVLPRLLPKVAKKNDLIILLSNLPAADNQRIAQTYSDIHLIIQSGSSSNSISTEPVNNTVLVSTLPQGKQLGIMNINWQRSKRWGDKKIEALNTKKRVMDNVRRQLGSYLQVKDPETSLRNQPDQLRAYLLLKAREETLQDEINRISTEISQNPPGKDEPSSYANRFMPMETNLPDMEEVVRLTGQLETDLFKLGQIQSQKTAPLSVSPYLGSAPCGACHATQLAAWQRTKHALAYTTLANRQQQFNLNCLPCHVTGVALNQGHEALSLPAERRGVGCETCHGPGRAHGKAPKGFVLTRRPGAEVCRTCHTPPHDEAFDYETRIKQVGH